MHPLLQTAANLILLGTSLPAASLRADDAATLPNVVIIFADDMGYGDAACYGNPKIQTPNLDRLALEGTRFTRFYVAQAVCSASRVALLTGCYPPRVGIDGALMPDDRVGLSSGEWTLAEMFKARGYATGMSGKWHLGHFPQFFPIRHGFDEWFGLPYSNDMWPVDPGQVGPSLEPSSNRSRFPNLPLYENDRVIDASVDAEDQALLTTQYTERAVRFIERNKDRPFFFYLAHSMPHVPLFVSDKFKGHSAAGLYGDVIEEIDWSVGQILAALERNDLSGNTLVIFTSDNGPWLCYGNHAGSAGPLREGKRTCWEGGIREPCLMRWPARIPAGRVCDEPLMTIDLLPTLARLVGGELPTHAIDGLDVWPILSGEPGAKNPHQAYYLYLNNQLQAVISGPWKLLFPHSYVTLEGRPGGTNGVPVKYGRAMIEQVHLYDLTVDIGEARDISEKYPEVVKHLEELADQMRSELGDALTHRAGKGVRKADKALLP